MPAPRVTTSADVAVVDVVGARPCRRPPRPSPACVIGIVEPDRLGRLPQPLDVLVEPEDLAAVAADALEDAVAVEQAVVVDADLGVFLVVRACR